MEKDFEKEFSVIAEAIIDARKVQEYIWQELSLIEKPYQYNMKIWQYVFQKRVDRIKEIDISHPSFKIELRKRLLQQAALSIAAMALLDSENN